MSIIEKAMEKAQKTREEQQEMKTSLSAKAQDTTQTEPVHPAEALEAVAPEVPVIPADTVDTMDTMDAHSMNTDFMEQTAMQAATVKPTITATPPQITQINPVPELIMATDQALTLGGSYRLLKEYIIALRKNQPESTLFMLTSPMRNEGKTLTSCNLACALAMEFDTTVLLIDVDLRAPSCHRVLGVQNPPKGLSDCLLHNTPITDCLIHTGIGKLSLLCAGSLIDNPAELVTSKRMQDFLQEVKHRYPDRIIILDSLPLLPFAESRALSRMVDGVMLVVRENETYKHHVDAALVHLQDVPLLGLIYNAATAYGTEKDIFNYSYYREEN